MFAKRTLSVLTLGGALFLGTAAYAADSTTPAADAVPPPSATAVANADQLLTAMGVKETIAKTVPAMMTEFEQNVTTTHPELRDSLRETLQAIKPQFDKSAQDVYVKAEALLATAMSEKELADVTTFFSSPSGKKYLEIEPMFFQRLQDVVGPWRQDLSSDIVAKAREAMKKKGIDF